MAAASPAAATAPHTPPAAQPLVDFDMPSGDFLQKLGFRDDNLGDDQVVQRYNVRRREREAEEEKRRKSEPTPPTISEQELRERQAAAYGRQIAEARAKAERERELLAQGKQPKQSTLTAGELLKRDPRLKRRAKEASPAKARAKA